MMPNRLDTSTLLLGSLCFAACASSSDAPPTTTREAPAPFAREGGAEAIDGGSGAPPPPAVDAGPSPPPPPPAACTMVDVLFVIDNSGSMGSHQDGLVRAFPQFVDAMFEHLPPNVSLHVGVTSTDFCPGGCGEATANCETNLSNAEIEACYMAPHEGHFRRNGAQGRLRGMDGARYWEVNTSAGADGRAALTDWFSRTARVGEDGCSVETATAAAAYTFSDLNAGANEGFHREGSVLVMVVLSDEPDKSPEPLDHYVDLVRSAKGECGDECVITAGLVSLPCVRDRPNVLRRFLGAFGEEPPLGSIDRPARYADVVGRSLAQVVARTCEDLLI